MLCWKPTQLAFKKYCIYLSYKCIIKTVPTFLHAISKKDTIEEKTHFHPIPMFFLFVFNCSMYPKTAVWCKVKLVSWFKVVKFATPSFEQSDYNYIFNSLKSPAWNLHIQSIIFCCYYWNFVLFKIHNI